MATYISLITNVGLSKINAALAGGNQIRLAEFAIGDGNGASVSPTQEQTSLANEVYRTAVNAVGINAEGALVAEVVIPQTVGGFTVREMGIYDIEGDLFAIASTPTIVKPDVAENAAAELVLRIILTTANAGTVQLTAGSTVIATRDWVEANFAIGNQLNGGTTGQVLTKKSNVDGDTEWRSPADVNVVVNTIEETQTLIAGDTIIALEVCTTTGLAVYVDGVRLPREAWVADTATQITLTAGYAADRQLTMVQNEPAAGIEAIKVGQVIMLGISTPPATLLGYGSWEQVAKGRAVFGWDVEDADFSTVRKRGGSKEHTHSASSTSSGAHSHSGSAATAGEHSHSGSTNAAGDHGHTASAGAVPGHSHSGKTADHSLTAAENGPHAHGGYSGGGFERGGGKTAAVIPTVTQRNSGEVDSVVNSQATVAALTTVSGEGEGHAHGISADGGHSHPITVTRSGSHSHKVETQSGGGHSHAVTVGSAGEHSHTISVQIANSLNPYETLALWLRVA